MRKRLATGSSAVLLRLQDPRDVAKVLTRENHTDHTSNLADSLFTASSRLNRLSCVLAQHVPRPAHI